MKFVKKSSSKFKKIIDKIKNFNYKEYANTNRQFIAFIVSNLINACLLRFFTVNNYFAIKPVLADLALILILGSFVYLLLFVLLIHYIIHIICLLHHFL